MPFIWIYKKGDIGIENAQNNTKKKKVAFEFFYILKIFLCLVSQKLRSFDEKFIAIEQELLIILPMWNKN